MTRKQKTKSRKQKPMDVGGKRSVRATEEDIEREKLRDEILSPSPAEESPPIEVGEDQRLYEGRELKEMGYTEYGREEDLGAQEGRIAKKRLPRGRKVA